MAFPIHELAALGTAACWATTGLIAADAVHALGAFHFNLIRQVFVALILALVVTATGAWAGLDRSSLGLLAASGLIGILMGDTFNFAAVGRLGPRRAGAVFALNAPMAAVLGWAVPGEELGAQAVAGIGLAAAGLVAATPLAPPLPRAPGRLVLALTAVMALIGLLLGMTLFLYALQGSKTGIIATLSATSPVITLPLL